MAKISLAVKYRPKTFDDVCEQKAIKDILQEQIKNKTFQHAYLFCGPAGCGKTTAARIFANDINSGMGAPIEVDAASNSGVDNIREIIENAKRKSLDSEYKVYIIDECHSLSNGAWQAMLKLLEEPPKCTIFIMCTTDPQKIPATIISRVQRYNFSKISFDTIVDRLKYIMENEYNEKLKDDNVKSNFDNYSWDEDALEYIAKMSDGGMRDAITMLDKCLSLSSQVTVKSAVIALGAVDYKLHFQLLKTLNSANSQAAITIIEDIYNSGIDLKQFLKQFQYFIIDVCKYHLFSNFKYLQIPQLEEYEKLMAETDKANCINVLNFIGDLTNKIKWESNVKYAVEALILAYCQHN